jgi:uncharacterized protein
VKFWDASAIVPLLVAEPTTHPLQALAGRDPEMLVRWGSEVECISALAQLERAAALDVKGLSLASERLKQLADGWHEIEPSDILRESAMRFLRVHPLRAAEALQLAAAFMAAERRTVARYQTHVSPVLCDRLERKVLTGVCTERQSQPLVPQRRQNESSRKICKTVADKCRDYLRRRIATDGGTIPRANDPRGVDARLGRLRWG